MLQETSGKKKAVMKSVTAFFFIFFILATSMTADTFEDGFRMDAQEIQSSSYNRASNAGYKDDLNGKINIDPSYPVYSTPLSVTNLYGSPLSSELVENDTTQYLVTYDTNYNIKVWKWNTTTNTFITLATSPTGDSQTYHQPIIAKFSDKSYPYIVVGNNSLISYFSFNGTSFKRECQSSVAYPYPYQQASFIFDQAFQEVYFVGGHEIGAFDSNCVNLTPMNLGDTQGTIIPKMSQDGSVGVNYGYTAQPALASLHGDGNHQIIIPAIKSIGTFSAFLVYSHANDGTFALDSLFNGDDYFNGDYTCNNGICLGVSESYKITNPVYDAVRNQIYFAGENGTNCGNYCMWAMNSEGQSVWNTESSFLYDNCGGNTQKKNVTFFDLALIDNKDAASSQYQYGSVGASAVCGACQKENDLYVAVACYDTLDGKELATNRFYIGKNLYQDEVAPSYAFKVYPKLSSGNYNSFDGYQELYIYDQILPNDLLSPPLYSFPVTPYSAGKKYAYMGFAALKPYSEDYNINPMIFLVSNGSTIFYYTDRKSILPEYVPNTYIVAPPNNKPLCLNFTKNTGLNVRYWVYDAENDAMYDSHYCDVNTIGGYYYNWTNWTYVGQGGQKYVEFYCRYNQTGTITLKTQLTDEMHLLYYTPLEYNSHSVVYSIIDSVYPYCYNSLTYSSIENPIILQNETDDEILTRLNMTRNETISGAFKDVFESYGLVSQNDKMIFGLMILFAVIIVMVFAGLNMHAERTYYTYGIPIVVAILFLLGTILGIFSVWITIVLFIIVALLGSMVFLRLTGQQSGTG